MTWQDDKRWSDKFIPQIKSILGGYLIGEASQEEDTLRNTDLVVLQMEAKRIGCRVRRHQFAEDYSDEFTIRAGRPSGNETELSKVVSGWGDYFFYGFADTSESRLAAWLLGDLYVFRYWFNRYLAEHRGRAPGRRICNHDKSSDFLVFCIADLPERFVIGRQLT